MCGVVHCLGGKLIREVLWNCPFSVNEGGILRLDSYSKWAKDNCLGDDQGHNDLPMLAS